MRTAPACGYDVGKISAGCLVFQSLSLYSHLSLAEAHLLELVHWVFVAVTGDGSVGECDRLTLDSAEVSTGYTFASRSNLHF